MIRLLRKKPLWLQRAHLNQGEVSNLSFRHENRGVLSSNVVLIPCQVIWELSLKRFTSKSFFYLFFCEMLPLYFWTSPSPSLGILQGNSFRMLSASEFYSSFPYWHPNCPASILRKLLPKSLVVSVFLQLLQLCSVYEVIQRKGGR